MKCIWFQRIESLGFEVGSNTMYLYLPSRKLEKIRKECRSAHTHKSSRPPDSQKASKPDWPAYLYNPSSAASTTTLLSMQHFEGKALRNSHHCYNTIIPLDEDALKDLDPWLAHATGSNDKPIKLPMAERIMESDASTTGWPMGPEGSPDTCQLAGVKAAFQNICTKLDECVCPTAAGQLNCSCLNKKKKYKKKAISSVVGVVSGEGYHSKSQRHSRSRECQGRLGVKTQTGPSDWRMESTGGFVCSETQHTVTSVFQLQAVAVDAFAQDWLDLTMYVFPPFLMVGRCLQKTREEKVEKIVIVGPLWRSQAWYHPRKHQQSLAFFTSQRIC